MTHDIKSWPGSWESVACGLKKHEVRKADRPFHIGDSIVLREFMPNLSESGLIRDAEGKVTGKYTGRSVLRRISYITEAGTWGLPNDICILSLATESEQAAQI